MTSPAETNSYRSRWLSSGKLDLPDHIDPLIKIVDDHLAEGWSREEDTDFEIVFSRYLSDGRKWTRFYDKKICRLTVQHFDIPKDIEEVDDKA